MSKEKETNPADIWAGESVQLTEEQINAIPEIKSIMDKFESLDDGTLIVEKVCRETKTITFKR